MKTASQLRDVETDAGAGTEFKIKANSKAFRVLIDGLYADKIQSVTREIWSNALDSHIMAGCEDRPFDVTFPDVFTPEFIVRDFGVGLSHEQVVNLYTTLFESTKEDTNNQVGKFGIGSKSPFAYTDTFSIMAIKDGECNYYSAVIGPEGLPTIYRLHTEATDELNGVQVSFPVRKEDVNAFQRAAKRVALGFDVKPNVTNIKDFEWETDPSEVLHKGVWAKMGCVIYPVDLGIICEKMIERVGPEKGEPISRFIRETNGYECKVIDVPVGMLEISASRENLSYGRNEPTVDTIVSILAKDYYELQPRLQAAMDKFPSHYHLALFLKPTDRGYSFNSRYDIDRHKVKLKAVGVADEDMTLLQRYAKFYNGDPVWRGERLKFGGPSTMVPVTGYKRVNSESQHWRVGGEKKRDYPVFSDSPYYDVNIMEFYNFVFIDGDKWDAMSKPKVRKHVRSLVDYLEGERFESSRVVDPSLCQAGFGQNWYNFNPSSVYEPSLISRTIMVIIRGDTQSRVDQLAYYDKLFENMVEGLDYSLHFEDNLEIPDPEVVPRASPVKRSQYERVNQTVRRIITCDGEGNYYQNTVFSSHEFSELESSESEFIHVVYTVKNDGAGYFHKDGLFQYNSDYTAVYSKVAKYFGKPVMITNKTDSEYIEKYYTNSVKIETLDMSGFVDVMRDVKNYIEFMQSNGVNANSRNIECWALIYDRTNNKRLNLCDYGIDKTKEMGLLMDHVFGVKPAFEKSYDDFYYSDISLSNVRLLLTGVSRYDNDSKERAQEVLDNTDEDGGSFKSVLNRLSKDAEVKYPMVRNLLINSYNNYIRCDFDEVRIGPIKPPKLLLDIVEYIKLIDEKDV